MFTDQHWYVCHDGDPRALQLYLRHYSSSKSRARRVGRPVSAREQRIVGPGEHLMLLTSTCDALFVWRLQRLRGDNQTGVECTIFRNEGHELSSELILEAERFAWARWPLERLFTFVDSRKIRSTNPGYCFIRAGWTCLPARTKERQLHIFEKLPLESD